MAEFDLGQAYFLRCLILARMRRFLRPTFRRPLPVRFVPTFYDLVRLLGQRDAVFRVPSTSDFWLAGLSAVMGRV